MLLFGMVYYLICCFGLVVGVVLCWLLWLLGFGVLLLICAGSGLLCFAFNDVDMWVSFIDCVCCYLLLFSCLRLWSVCLAVYGLFGLLFHGCVLCSFVVGVSFLLPRLL